MTDPTIPDAWAKLVLDESTRPSFWQRFTDAPTTHRGPLTRRERMRYWRKFEAPRRLRYAWQVLSRGYHDGEDA